RYQGSRAAIASSRELPQRRQKCRAGSLPSPHWPQMRSPGWRRVGGSMVRGPGRGRVTAGATDVGRREAGSSAAGRAAGALGAPTPANTGSGDETGAAAACSTGAAARGAAVSGGAAGALGTAEATTTSRLAGCEVKGGSALVLG